MAEQLSLLTTEPVRPNPRPPVGAMTRPQRVELLAHHEAGHALVCFILYGEQVIREVDLFGAEPDAPSGMGTYSLLPIPIVCRPISGVPRRGNPAPVSPEAIVDAHGVLSYAGSLAEALSQGHEIGDALPEDLLDEDQLTRFAADRQSLARLADTVRLSRSSQTFYPEYWKEAERLLRGHWHGVSVIAESLAERGALNGDRIDALLQENCHL